MSDQHLRRKSGARKGVSYLKKAVAVLLTGLLFAGTVLILRRSSTRTFQENEGFIFGTVYHIKYAHDKDLEPEIREQLQRVDQSLSMFNERSVIARVNRGEDVAADSMFVHVFRLARKVSEQTGGAFDITVAPLVQAWGFGFEHADSITPALLDSLRAFVGHEKVRLEGRAVVKADPRVMLDCSAVAKGYGVDAVARLFDRLGIRNYMIEIGGEVVVRGHNPERKDWLIGVSRPVDDTLSAGASASPQVILEVTDRALATSGNYRRFYYRNGRKYAHTIDPHTGQPVEHSLLSASVLAPDCATADAYATAFMVMGVERAKALLRSHPELEAYFIYERHDGKVVTWHTPGLEKYISR